MLADLSTSNKSLASSTASNDSILEGKELIETLFSVLKDCDVCTGKLKNLLGVGTPSNSRHNLQGATRKLYYEYEERGRE